MAFLTYRQTRPWAKAIRESVLLKKMPPWFAEPGYGPFSNDRSLSQPEIDTLVHWAESGAPEGNVKESPPARPWVNGWNIAAPDAVLTMPRPFPIPASGELDYQYIVLPGGFSEDQWVEAAEMRPGNRSVVHHAVVYVREPGSTWLRDAKPGVPYVPPGQTPRERLVAGITTSEILLVYSPGNVPEQWPPGLAKLIKAGSDLVLETHYTPNGHATSDRSKLGLVFARTPPSQRVMTLQMGNDRFLIPPGHPHYAVSVRGTLPNDATLLGYFPHMHLRGQSFEYNLVERGSARRPLLRVTPYNFYWQLFYRLATPLPLKAGTELEFVGYFDNSRRNPNNPDPEEAVRFGPQSREEMMIGFFDVAVDPHMDKAAFFLRPGTQ
ncbi:MAG: thiol-disulfide isomerase [Candidatus Solibacter usitatus]|nr:thiol-disulfide isomerase [Candidatus Solibacter usitatus]